MKFHVAYLFRQTVINRSHELKTNANQCFAPAFRARLSKARQWRKYIRIALTSAL